MTYYIAEQIAKLLNERNQLDGKYTAEKVLEKKSNYVFIQEKNEVIACAESLKIQWYQHEIKHVSVAERFEGKGLGKKILKLAEEKADKENARILQCTVRSNNESSLRLFIRQGYVKVNQFYNRRTENWIFVLQKSISINI